MFKNLILKISKSRNSLAELLRTYIVGIFNLLFGLSLNYIFQFVILVTVSFPLRTYLTNTFSFVFGVIVSYFLSRRIIFNLSFFDGTLKEFIKFVTINFINLFVPLLIWFLINLWNTDLQKNEFYYLVITVIIHGSILPVKYLIYKFFVFKDSL
tara:strand:- start:676 stop:1137 length:462 start_codon:yes stop_codon:yes gene_type:complete